MSRSKAGPRFDERPAEERQALGSMGGKRTVYNRRTRLGKAAFSQYMRRMAYIRWAKMRGLPVEEGALNGVGTTPKAPKHTTE